MDAITSHCVRFADIYTVTQSSIQHYSGLYSAASTQKQCRLLDTKSILVSLSVSLTVSLSVCLRVRSLSLSLSTVFATLMNVYKSIGHKGMKFPLG